MVITSSKAIGLPDYQAPTDLIIFCFYVLYFYLLSANILLITL